MLTKPGFLNFHNFFCKTFRMQSRSSAFQFHKIKKKMLKSNYWSYFPIIFFNLHKVTDIKTDTHQYRHQSSLWWLPRVGGCSSSCLGHWRPPHSSVEAAPPRRARRSRHCVKGSDPHHPWHGHLPHTPVNALLHLSSQNLESSKSCKL